MSRVEGVQYRLVRSKRTVAAGRTKEVLELKESEKIRMHAFKIWCNVANGDLAGIKIRNRGQPLFDEQIQARYQKGPTTQGNFLPWCDSYDGVNHYYGLAFTPPGSGLLLEGESFIELSNDHTDNLEIHYELFYRPLAEEEKDETETESE